MQRAKKLLALVGVIVVLVLVFQFGVKPRMLRFQAWEGAVEELFRLYDHSKTSSSPHPAEHVFYNHYWRVKCDDGRVREVRLPYHVWGKATEGDRVVKRSGEAFPEVLATEGVAQQPEVATEPPQEAAESDVSEADSADPSAPTQEEAPPGPDSK